MVCGVFWSSVRVYGTRWWSVEPGCALLLRRKTCIFLEKNCGMFSEEDRLYLAESGLDLWRDVLHNSNQMTASLLNLFQRWIFCMVRFTDYLKVCIDILRSYFLLGGRQFVERYHKEVTNSTTRNQISSPVPIEIAANGGTMGVSPTPFTP